MPGLQSSLLSLDNTGPLVGPWWSMPAIPRVDPPPPVATLNTFDGGTDTATITTGNSGGASGDPWTFVQIGSGGSATYTASGAYRGGLSGRFVTGTAGAITYAERSTGNNSQGSLYVRLRVQMPVLPPDATGVRFAVVADSAGAFQVDGRMTASGTVELRSGSGSLVGASSATYAAGQWVDVGLSIGAFSSTAGMVEMRLYDAAGAVTQTITSGATLDTLRGGGPNKVQVGAIRSGVNSFAVLVDDVAMSSTDYPALPSAGAAFTADAALAVTATFAAAAATDQPTAASLAVTAALAATASGSRPADAALAVTAALAAVASRTAPAAAALTATATLAADATVTAAGATAALAATATLTAAATTTGAATAALAITATATVAVTGTRPAAAALPITATLSAAASRTAPGAAALAITTTATASAQLTAASAAALPVTATLAAAATVGAAPVLAAAGLVITTTLSAGAARTARPAAALPVTVTLAASGARTGPASTALAVTVTLTGGGLRLQQLGAVLAVLATFAADATAQGSVTARPDTGTTTRPATGLTARAAAGSTVRPGTGITARPFAGVTPGP